MLSNSWLEIAKNHPELASEISRSMRGKRSAEDPAGNQMQRLRLSIGLIARLRPGHFADQQKDKLRFIIL
jgi:hypothetical protein